MCTHSVDPEGSIQVGNMVDILSQVSDIVRPKLLLEVKAANKVGRAIKRAFSREDGWLSQWAESGAEEAGGSCKSARDGFMSIFCVCVWPGW